jgi:EAL and modified HD-GYP domain-containing signal transduction protein
MAPGRRALRSPPARGAASSATAPPGGLPIHDGRAPMQTTVDDKIYIARQPILDVGGRCVAYELLFRSAPTGGAGRIDDPTRATARVIVNTINAMGTAFTVGGKKAFVNCDRHMLLERVFEPLNPDTFVLEIVEDVVGDDEVVACVAGLAEQGYEIALDDFVMTDEHLAKTRLLVPHANYVKLDLAGNTPAQMRSAVTRLRNWNPRLMFLAEKVETAAQHRTCLDWGYHLFQGYYFARPEVLEGRRIDPSIAAVMRILQMLRNDPQIEALEDAFKREPVVTLNLLKYINSAAIGLKVQIDSIRQALTIIGLRKLQQWLLLMVFAGGVGNAAGALFENAAMRARTMENLAHTLDADGKIHEQAFLVGVLSRMEALCGMGIGEILAEYDLGPQIAEALGEAKGVLGRLLRLVDAVESDDIEAVYRSCKSLGIDPDRLRSSVTESWSWLESLRT